MGEQDQRQGTLATLEGMTAAWQEATEALRDSERRYRELVEYSLGLICTHDLSGNILSINPAAATSLGYQPGDGIGRNLQEFLAPDTRHLFDDYLRRIQEHGHDVGLMRVVARGGGARVWMYRNVLSHGADGTYVLGHAIDITDRVEAERTLRRSEQALRAAHSELEVRVAERTAALAIANDQLRVEIAEREQAERSRQLAFQQAREANRLKDEFLSTLSHELRTPLNAIFGWARILRGKDLDEATAHAVAVIERNAEAQVRLIEEVLDVSRIINGKMTLAVELVDVASILRATIDTVRPSAHAKRIRLEERIEDTLPVLGDGHRLQQVFWNVLSNALKFTGSDGVISLRLGGTPTLVVFEVTDTGVGIRPDVLPFVFDRFRQADSSTTRTYGGLGLGLAIVKHIVELHGGRVRAASAGEGQGATFTIQLPAANRNQTNGQVPVGAAPETHAWPSALRGRTVLVVEDHDDARELVVGVLESAGARVLSASSAWDAIDRATIVPPDVLVADLGLPGEDGLVLLARLREMYPDLPALALTAFARPSDRERSLAAGFQQHVVKPVDPRHLVECIAAALSPRT